MPRRRCASSTRRREPHDVAVAYTALLIAAVIWGLSFPVTKFAVARLGPFDVDPDPDWTVTFARAAFETEAA